MQIGTYQTYPSDGQTTAEALYWHVKRYCLHTALAELGRIGARILHKDESLMQYVPSTLNEWQLAFIAKALILNSNDHRSKPFDQKALFDCAALFNNLYQKSIEDTDPQEVKISAFNSFLIRTANQQFPFQVAIKHLIPRAVLLFDEIPNSLSSPKFDIEKEVKEIYGLTPREIMTIGISMFAVCDRGYFNPNSLITAEIEWLKEYLTQEKVEKLIDKISADYPTLRELFRQEEGDIGLEQFAFNHLRAFPIVKTQITDMVIPVPRFLIERITNGIYFSLMDKFKHDKANDFLVFFGKEIFERYVGLLLKEKYHADQLLPEWSYGKKSSEALSPDWVIIEGDSATLIECKTSGITKEAKSWGDLEEVQASLRTRAVKGIKQIDRFIKDVKNGLPELEKLSKIKHFYPLIVTYDRIYLAGSPPIRKLIDAELSKEGVSTRNYQIISVSDLETLVPALNYFPLNDFLKMKLAELPNQETAEFDTFLYNVFRSKNMTVDLENYLLKSKFDEIFRRIQQGAEKA